MTALDLAVGTPTADGRGTAAVGPAPYILGLDISLVATGVARYTRTGDCFTDVVKTTGKRGDSIAQRHERLQDGYEQFRLLVPQMPVLAVVENPSFGSVGGSAWDRAGLWWQMLHRLLGRDVPVALLAPTTRAKWATGRGGADKAAVASALTGRYGFAFPSNDEADAAGLALAGAHWLGWVDGPKYATEALKGCTSWPDRSAVASC